MPAVLKASRRPASPALLTAVGRRTVTADTKHLAAGYGFKWVRANVTTVYGRTKLDELTDHELMTVHAQALADDDPNP